jgi:hypothetical protein
MTHCLCHERGTRFSAVPGSTPNNYNLKFIAIDGWVYLEIRKVIYGLKQAGLLANQLLQKRLEPYGYYPARHTQGLWLHKSRPIAFTLIVDDFAVKHVRQENAHHLRNALLRNYEITTDDKLLPLPHPPRARPHRRTDKSKRPESNPTKECARARERCLNTEPKYYDWPIHLVMS